MKRLSLTWILLLTFQNINFDFGYTRTIYIDKELKSASLIKEIIIGNYTSRIDTIPKDSTILTIKLIDKMTYSFLDNPDSNLTYTTAPFDNILKASLYKIADKNISNSRLIHGFWPAIGDTVLVIFNTEKHISLFAQILQSNTSYRFWSPFYNTSGLGTIFYANFPFEPFKPTDNKSYGWNKKTYAQLQKYAKEEEYDFACQYHCMISKNEFWKYLEKIK